MKGFVIGIVRPGLAEQCTVRVDPYRSPSQVDEVRENGRIDRGVYRRVGDEVLWAESTRPSGPRPSSFDPAPGVMVWTLRRVKK